MSYDENAMDCPICNGHLPHTEESFCPEAVVYRLRRALQYPKTTKSRRSPEWKREIESRLRDWTKVVSKAISRIRKQQGNPSPWIASNLPCPGCRSIKWTLGASRGGERAFVCERWGVCLACRGQGVTGTTKEERMAQRLGDFGKCMKCLGSKQSRCGRMLIDAPK